MCGNVWMGRVVVDALVHDRRGKILVQETPQRIGEAASEVPSKHLPPVVYEDLPEPLPLGKVLGPGVVSIGIGVSSGELIIWPYITSQVGLVFLWAAVVGVLRSFSSTWRSNATLWRRVRPP